jgi:hypothetical protein
MSPDIAPNSSLDFHGEMWSVATELAQQIEHIAVLPSPFADQKKIELIF